MLELFVEHKPTIWEEWPLLEQQLFLVIMFHFADAEGKICPHTLRRMPSGMPCSFGSKALFSSEEIRDEASATYHKYEYK